MTLSSRNPLIAILVSDEAATYRPEMLWLAEQLQRAGRRVFCLRPEDVFPLGSELFFDVEGTPDARFLPPMLRRRCTPLTKAMLHVAFAACPEDLRGAVRTVFASRHGELRESFPLFELVVSGQPLSPTRFTHTVHNAQAAMYSIAAGNRRASSALAGERDTFGTPDELKPVIATMKKATVTLHVVPGGDHSLAVRGKKKDEAFEGVLDVVAAWITSSRTSAVRR